MMMFHTAIVVFLITAVSASQNRAGSNVYIVAEKRPDTLHSNSDTITFTIDESSDNKAPCSSSEGCQRLGNGFAAWDFSFDQIGGATKLVLTPYGGVGGEESEGGGVEEKKWAAM
ncbi:unnamed protein product [Clonostachys rosea]|uniref:Uncharacterized protein n=1 Tax=Bionectria ochroleuca TaxID=29856 RepID=A0ABY6U492_BIOOC|nr:unnamed protein product [Clonostachys rosea]